MLKETKKRPSLSIVIPAYNEEQCLDSVLTDCLEKLPKYFKEYEILVVDDGSSDKTQQIANFYASKNKRIKVILQKHQGYNQAMITGIKKAKYDYVGYMQADGQNKVKDFEKCYKILQDYDLVMVGRGKPSDYSLLRLVLHYGCFALYYILFGLKYKDPHWVYFWKTDEIQNLGLDARGGVFLLVESLIKFKRKGLKITEMPFTVYRPRMGGQQNAVKPKVIFRTLKSIFSLWYQIKVGKI